MDRAAHQGSVVEHDCESLAAESKVHAGRRILTAVTVTLAIAGILAVYLLRLDPAVGVFNDDGWYLVLAKSLATGQGYRLINLSHSGYHFIRRFFRSCFRFSIVFGRIFPVT
jgi:hypothetical protein